MRIISTTLPMEGEPPSVVTNKRGRVGGESFLHTWRLRAAKLLALLGYGRKEEMPGALRVGPRKLLPAVMQNSFCRASAKTAIALYLDPSLTA